MSTTKALVAYHHATYGGVYYSADIDFSNSAVQPTWARLSTTGLANNLVKVMQNDPVAPYDKIYIQLDNDDIYIWNGASWTKILDLATARTLTGFASGLVGFVAQDKTIAGNIYLSVSADTVGVLPKILKSVDYGANWSVMSVDFGGGIPNSPFDGLSVSNGIIWYCSSNIYRSLFYYDGSWRGDFNIWPNSAGGAQINIDPLDPTACYYTDTASDTDLVKHTYSGGYSETVCQNGASLGYNYDNNVISSSPSYGPGSHWFSILTAGKQRIIKRVGASFLMYQTADTWANLLEASPTDWNAIISIDSIAQNAALENESYVLIGCCATASPGVQRVYAWIATSNTATSQPWAIAGTNHNTGPYTNAIPSVSGAYVSVYGVFVGEAPATKGVYVYADEQGDITDIPDYDGLGTPLFGDRASWRDRNVDGFDIYHAEDVERDEREIHTPQPTGNDGYGIIEDGGFWINSSDQIAMVGDLHDPVTLDVDAAVILDLNGQEIGLDVQNANTVFAGPASGAANEPTFRALVALDLATGGDATKYLRGDMSWASSTDAFLDYLHEHAVNEDLSGLCDGSRVIFILANEYTPETTAFYLNGVRQLITTDYTEDAGYDQVTFSTAPIAGDTLIVDYILAGAI